MDTIGLVPHFGSLALTILAFVVALSVIVAIHEYGHYIIGRLCGIHAEVFSLGFGRVLWSRTDWRGTRWQIAAIPLGGYVKFLGDANAASAGGDAETLSKLSSDELRHTMHGAPLWARAATVAAGPVFNLILSMIVFSGYFLATGLPTERPSVAGLVALPGGSGAVQAGDVILAIDGRETPDWKSIDAFADDLPATPVLTYRVDRGGAVQEVQGPALQPPRIAGIQPASAAFEAGLQVGDVIASINGQPIATFDEIKTTVERTQGQPLDLLVWRAGATSKVTLTPRVTDVPKSSGGFEKRYLIGLFGDLFFTPQTRSASLREAVTGAAGSVWYVASSSISGLAHVVAGKISTCNVGGAVGIAKASGFAASQGLSDFIWFIAVLSTAVGLLNLFPIPVLDGGHLLFHAYEWATGRPLPDKVLNVAFSIGLFIVVGFMIFGLTNDLTCP